jgi:glycerophosphoryl diester phosphodiesterase
MKPVHVKVFLVDPVTGERFAVSDDVQVDIVRIESPAEGEGNPDVLPLERTAGADLFFADAPGFQVTRKHHFRVRFLKPNFSKSARKLLDYEQVTARSLPIFCPARLPYWDSGWADYYNFNRYFGRHDVTFTSSPGQPLSLDVPIREMFVIGHRGAPHRFPENTMASFRQALDLGANGLEIDLCLTKDRKVAVFHDPEPVKFPSRIDRTMFEGLPYPLISPIFDITGREVCVREAVEGTLTEGPARPLVAEDEFDILNLTFEEARRYYHYALVEGKDHPVPSLEEFLDFASSERHHLRFVFLDVKNPAGMRRREFAAEMGSVLARALHKHNSLPEHVVVCNEDPAVLLRLKRAMHAEGEQRCQFAYDASGGIREYIGMERKKILRLPSLFRTLIQALLPYRYNPLEVARRMKNSVVSVGNLMRPAHLEEISSAVRDRDHNARSPVEVVVHWTLNETAQYAESLSAGVNGILTDRPEKLAEYLRSLDVRVTCP